MKYKFKKQKLVVNIHQTPEQLHTYPEKWTLIWKVNDQVVDKKIISYSKKQKLKDIVDEKINEFKIEVKEVIDNLNEGRNWEANYYKLHHKIAKALKGGVRWHIGWKTKN